MTVLPDLCTPELPRSRYQIHCGAAHIQVHARRLATVLRVDGEADASNADLIAEAIRGFSRLKAPLILDLADVDFLAGSAFSALLVLNEEHRRAQLRCCVVSGAALRRLTRVVPDHGLPVVDSLDQALGHIERATTARRRLVAEPPRQHEPQRDTSTRLRGLAS